MLTSLLVYYYRLGEIQERAGHVEQCRKILASCVRRFPTSEHLWKRFVLLFCRDSLLILLFVFLFLYYFQEGRCQWPNFTIFVQLFDRIIEIFKDSESDESVDLIKQASVFSSLAYKLDRMVTPRTE